jgi:hypothetical protein
MLTPDPPRIIELAGSPWERGRRHGELLAREIRLMRRALLQYLSLLTFYLGALPLLAVLQLFTCLSFWPQIPARLKEELRGVASGAHLGLPLVLLINTLDDLANNLASCSALAVGEGRTAQGLFLAGRNLDYPVFLDVLVDLKTLFLITPDQGVPLVSLAWPGYVGVLTGMNRAGVALAQLTAMCQDTTLKGLPAGLRHRLALEQETTVRDVAARILEPPRTIGNNLLLCGPREALVLEVSAHRHGVRRPSGGVITATNHFQSDAMEPVKGEFRRIPPGAVLAPYYFTEAYSRDRNTRLQELAANRSLGPGDLQAILGDPGIANPGTVNSTVFAPAELTLWVAPKQSPPVSQGQFAAVKLWEAGP